MPVSRTRLTQNERSEHSDHADEQVMSQLPDQVRDYICSLSNEQLITYIVTGIDAYEPEAVEFAREEFQRRELDASVVATLESAAVSRVATERIAREEATSRPLESGDRAIAFVLGIFIEGLIHVWIKSEKLRNAGEDRRSAETLKFGCAGFVTIFVLIIIFSLLHWRW
ncbi:MAG TPA: hypothetical protein VFE47_31525 [Tepidisphaeraceae bacterium]|jgi:hypothetical protein|nr:hypothetical protein [Tepidisphaeraceae bacterium]